MENNLINLREEDLNKSIYRIYSYNYFIKMLENSNNVLVKTKLWEDPFENFILNSTGKLPTGELFTIGSRDKYFGQCWSLKKESDAMWRIYSQHLKDKKTDEIIIDSIGIKVKSTIKKVFEPLHSIQNNQILPSNKKPYNLNSFLGKVIYKKKKELLDLFKNDLDNIIYDQLGKNQASTLMLKRIAFSHEKEVRIIYYSDKSNDNQNIFSYEIDPNIMFEEIVIDPRISKELFEKIKVNLVKHGYKNKIIQSGLYKIEDFQFTANLP